MPTPTGAPFWVHANDHTTYGGHSQKRNYRSQGAINARTDVTAEEFVRLADDLARMGWVTEFANISLTNDDTGANDPTVDHYDAAAGSAPAVARVSDGVVTLTWSAAYTDSYSVSGDLDLRHVHVTVEGTSVGVGTWVLSDPDANSKNERVTIYLWDAAGAALTDATYTVTVYTSAQP